MIELRDPYHSLDHFWMDIIIAVHKHIIIAIRMIECSISCCGNPSIFIDIYVNVWEFFCVFLTDFYRTIWRSIVDQHNFYIWIALS